jgi:hypothetical protein
MSCGIVNLVAIQVELMKRKQKLLHLDQRQIMLLENAYYQVCRVCGPNLQYGAYCRSGQPS